MITDLRNLPLSVSTAVESGLAQYLEDGEPRIPVVVQDDAGDRFGYLTDDEWVARGYRVDRVVVVVSTAPVAAADDLAARDDRIDAGLGTGYIGEFHRGTGAG